MNFEEPVILCETQVAAPIEDVWNAWTTVAGVTSFFAPMANVVPKPGGSYEILFNPTAPRGDQGAEGMTFLALNKPEFFSFTWNAPPHLPEVRGQMTVVQIRLSSTGANCTQVNLRHSGWAIGGQWDQAFNYFSKAWADVVLPRLCYRFSHGPVDWNKPPAL